MCLSCPGRRLDSSHPLSVGTRKSERLCSGDDSVDHLCDCSRSHIGDLRSISPGRHCRSFRFLERLMMGKMGTKSG